MSQDRWIETPPAGAEGWRRVWSENLAYRPPERWGFLGRLLGRVVARLMGTSQDRQRDFNLATLDLLDGQRHDLEIVRDDFLGEIKKVRETLPVVAGRGDALVSAVDRKLESLEARVRDLSLPLLTATQSVPYRDDFVYRRLEDALRGSEAEIRRDLAPWVEMARSHAPAVDIGCGRGELLELCRDAGIAARGFDSNERSIADLAARGLDVRLAPIPACFDLLEAGSVGSVFASHVVEHLPFSLLVSFFSGASRVLREGGLLVIETPNAQSLFVSGSEFWRDPTHLAPRHEAALVTLGNEAGFEIERIETIHPAAEGHLLRSGSPDPHIQQLVEAINRRLFGDQDLRLALRKKKG